VQVHIDRVDIPNLPPDQGLISALVVAESWGTAIADPDV
jgi:hypothetical protein